MTLDKEQQIDFEEQFQSIVIYPVAKFDKEQQVNIKNEVFDDTNYLTTDIATEFLENEDLSFGEANNYNDDEEDDDSDDNDDSIRKDYNVVSYLSNCQIMKLESIVQQRGSKKKFCNRLKKWFKKIF